MYPTSTRPDRRDAPDHGLPAPGVQAVLLALFVAGLWAVSYPAAAAALAAGAAAVALGRRYDPTRVLPAAGDR